jgi:hypothetical protein
VRMQPGTLHQAGIQLVAGGKGSDRLTPTLCSPQPADPGARRSILLLRRDSLPMLLLITLLAWSAGDRADEGTAASSAAEADTAAPAPTAPPRVRAPRPRVHHTPGQGIEQTVSRLTRALTLDATQQARLREILLDEQRQARRLRQNPPAGIDWVSATATIVDQSKARIRAILTDEQKKKYFVDTPRGDLAPARADLQHYLQIQEAKRVAGAGASKDDASNAEASNAEVSK